MVLCFVAMFVFAVLGIFSATHRKYAKEAFECSFRLVTFRPCQSDFDQKMKTKIVTKLMKFPKIAKFTHKNFKAISIILVIAFMGSTAYTGYGVYNLAIHGTCDPQHPENCMFTPMMNTTQSSNAEVCNISGEFVEFYGKGCPFCQEMKPVVEKVEKETGITFQKLEVWNNETNQETMLKYAKDIQEDCNGVLGVPAFYATKTGEAICGKVSDKVLKEFIRDNG